MIPNLSSTAQSSLGRAEGGKERSEGGWGGGGGRGGGPERGRSGRSRHQQLSGQKIQLKQISVLNKQWEEPPRSPTPPPVSSSFTRSFSSALQSPAGWKRSGTKTITDGASEIFSRSMASGSSPLRTLPQID